MKFIENMFLTLTLLATLALSVAAQRPMPEIPSINVNLTPQQWQDDLRHFAEELPKRHKNAFHTMTRPQFEAAVKDLHDRIPRLRTDEIFVGFLKLIAMVGDGHTAIFEPTLLNFGVYPIHYHVYPQGLYVQSALAGYEDLVGGKVVRIGNMPVEAALEKIRSISWGDHHNEQSIKVEMVFLLTNPKVLRGLGLADTAEKIDITVDVGGHTKTVVVNAVKDVRGLMGHSNMVLANRNSNATAPLYLRNNGQHYWSEYLKDARTMYVQFNDVIDKRDEPISAFFKRVIETAEANSADKFVLDVRANTGGNNLLNRPIVTGLIRSKFNERGKLFVITGRRTFSAAQNLVNELEKYTNAIFVGEPTGSSPNMYGDPVIITLPNSRLPFRVSSLWHQTDPRDRRIYTTPEIYAEVTPADYAANVDPVMNAILSYTPGRTFKDLTAEAVAGSDIRVFLAKYREFKNRAENKFANTESQTNALGYELVRAKRLADAIEVFKLNVESYPGSANVYDSLAEAYALNGNKAEAISNYEKALKIDPNFSSAQEGLRRLKG